MESNYGGHGRRRRNRRRFSKAIETQAQTMGSKLGELTDQSGYGNDPGKVAQIMQQQQGGIGAQFPVLLKR